MSALGIVNGQGFELGILLVDDIDHSVIVAGECDTEMSHHM